MKTSVHWTKGEETYLFNNWLVMSPRDIAIHLGRSETATRRKAWRQGLKIPKKLNKTVEILRENEGKYTGKELAQILGKSRPYVGELARRHGIKLAGHSKRRLTTPEEDEIIGNRYMAGERVVDIAKDYPHLPYSTVYNRALF